MNPAILIPYRPVNPERQRNYSLTHRFWDQLGWPIHVADSTDSARFDKAEAVNLAAAQATDADVLVITDIDILPGSIGQTLVAAERAHAEDAYVTTYSQLVTLDAPTTQTVCDAWPDPVTIPGSGIIRRYQNTWMGSLAVSRALFEECRGFDERFKGYGGQDVAFLTAALTLGGHGHAQGVAYHLHHPLVDTEHPLRAANTLLADRYRSAHDKPAVTRALIAERDR